MNLRGLGIGAQKSGTTTVWDILRRQPWFAAPVAKEINYFSSRFHLGEDWYRAQFPDVRPGRFSVDISPSYLRADSASARARAFDPSLRVFAILRDPVERAFSAYLHLQRNGRIGRSTTFEDVVGSPTGEQRFGIIIEQGYYSRLLTPWFENFGQSAVHVMFLQELLEQPEASCSALFRHLGVPDQDTVPVTRADLPHSNPARQTRYLPGKRLVLTAARAQSGRGRTRAARTLRSTARIFDRPAEGSQRPTMDAATREQLRVHYRPHDEELRRLLGRPLPW